MLQKRHVHTICSLRNLSDASLLTLLSFQKQTLLIHFSNLWTYCHLKCLCTGVTLRLEIWSSYFQWVRNTWNQIVCCSYFWLHSYIHSNDSQFLHFEALNSFKTRLMKSSTDTKREKGRGWCKCVRKGKARRTQEWFISAGELCKTKIMKWQNRL